MIAELTHSAQSDELWKFLNTIYQSKVPDPGGSLQIPFGQDGLKVHSSPSSTQNVGIMSMFNASFSDLFFGCE